MVALEIVGRPCPIEEGFKPSGEGGISENEEDLLLEFLALTAVVSGGWGGWGVGG